MRANLVGMNGPTPDPLDPDSELHPEVATDLITLPDTPLTDAAIQLLKPVVSLSVFNHSIRTYLFARLVAARRELAAGHDYDDELLFTACAMHDIGVASDGPHTQRFEVEGADRAAAFLVGHGRSAADADEVWQAIALHTSSGIAERRGPLCLLVREGVALDFGGPIGNAYADALSDEQADTVHAAYPRLDMVRSLTDAIVAHAAKSPKNGPRYTLPGELLRERQTYGRTRLEHDCGSSRWDD